MNSPHRAHLRFRESHNWIEAGPNCPHCHGPLYQPKPPSKIPHLKVWCPKCREENLGQQTRAEMLAEKRKREHAAAASRQPSFFPDRNQFKTQEELDKR